jgi:pimeloyl-ACP methyl ester carboxylesterase
MESFTASDGVQLAYYIDDFTDPWAPAPSLLLLHAAMGSAKRYFAWVPPLARHYRVVRMDLRGHGGSEVPPADRPLTLERLVDDVAALMDHLGCTSAHIVGNSAGGYLAQQLAMKHSGRVRSLMLFGSTPGLKNSQAPSWIPQIEAKGLRGFLAETIAERLPPPWRIEDGPVDGRELRLRREGQVDPGLVEWFLDEAAKNDPAYIGNFVLLMASYDWSGELSRIRCPTLVVVPGAEPIGSIANYKPFRRLVQDVEIRVYDGAPHNICDAFPERCAGDVLDFLGRRFGLGPERSVDAGRVAFVPLGRLLVGPADAQGRRLVIAAADDL